MAATGSSLGGTGTQSTASFTSFSFTASANALILLAIYSQRAGGGNNAPTVSGDNLTWVQHDTQLLGNYRATLFRAMGSPTTGGVTISFGGQTQDNITYEICQFTGVDTTGTNGSGAIVQENKNSQNTTATSLTVTNAAFASPNNVTYGSMMIAQQAAMTIDSNFTQFDQSSESNIASLMGWSNANRTSFQCTWGSFNGVSIGFSAEIKAQVIASGGFFLAAQ